MSNKYEIELQVENDLKKCKRENPDIYSDLLKQWNNLKKERDIWFEDLKKECEGKTEKEIFWIQCREIGKSVKIMDAASKRIDDQILRLKLSKLYK